MAMDWTVTSVEAAKKKHTQDTQQKVAQISIRPFLIVTLMQLTCVLCLASIIMFARIFSIAAARALSSSAEAIVTSN